MDWNERSQAVPSVGCSFLRYQKGICTFQKWYLTVLQWVSKMALPRIFGIGASGAYLQPGDPMSHELTRITDLHRRRLALGAMPLGA